MSTSVKFVPTNVFVTVGSTSFDELIKTVIHPDTVKHLKQLGCKRLTIQAGKYVIDPDSVTDIKFRNYEYTKDLAPDIMEADLVIGHAGAGTCIEVLRKRKRLLVVINDSLMDCHQDELANRLEEERYLIKTKLQNFHNNLDKICCQNIKLREFPPASESKFEGIFHRALMTV